MCKIVVVAIFVQFMIYLILAKKSLKFDQYKVCGKSKSCPFKLNNLDLQYTRRGGFSFFGEIEIYRDIINEKLEVVLAFQRCASRELLDSCEKTASIIPPTFCFLLDIKGFGIDEFRDGFEPPFRCPLKKGIHKIRNATVNPELFRLLPFDGYYWKMNGSIYENKIYLASLCFDFMVVNIRN